MKRTKFIRFWTALSCHNRWNYITFVRSLKKKRKPISILRVSLPSRVSLLSHQYLLASDSTLWGCNDEDAFIPQLPQGHDQEMFLANKPFRSYILSEIFLSLYVQRNASFFPTHLKTRSLLPFCTPESNRPVKRETTTTTMATTLILTSRYFCHFPIG